jgi:hypothetical protein
MKAPKKNRNKWLHIRLSDEEHNQLKKRFSQTTCRKLSDYSRRILFAGKITILHRNQSLDEFMMEMIQLRKELNALANNFNQAVKKLHTLQYIPEFKTWAVLNETSQQILLKKVEQIKVKINLISNQWLQ